MVLKARSKTLSTIYHQNSFLFLRIASASCLFSPHFVRPASSCASNFAFCSLMSFFLRRANIPTKDGLQPKCRASRRRVHTAGSFRRNVRISSICSLLRCANVRSCDKGGGIVPSLLVAASVAEAVDVVGGRRRGETGAAVRECGEGAVGGGR